jgi:hypothetical protein
LDEEDVNFFVIMRINIVLNPKTLYKKSVSRILQNHINITKSVARNPY